MTTVPPCIRMLSSTVFTFGFLCLPLNEEGGPQVLQEVYSQQKEMHKCGGGGDPLVICEVGLQGRRHEPSAHYTRVVSGLVPQGCQDYFCYPDGSTLQQHFNPWLKTPHLTFPLLDFHSPFLKMDFIAQLFLPSLQYNRTFPLSNQHATCQNIPVLITSVITGHITILIPPSLVLPLSSYKLHTQCLQLSRVITRQFL